MEYVPAEMKKNGAEAIHLATGLVVGYPPCPYIREFKQYIETAHGLTVVVGTHPVPEKYRKVHEQLPFWQQKEMAELAGGLLNEDREIQKAYD